MTKTPREIDRYTNEDTAQMQAVWTGIILAVAVFVASALYFTGKRAELASKAPTTIELPRASGNTTGNGIGR